MVNTCSWPAPLWFDLTWTRRQELWRRSPGTFFQIRSLSPHTWKHLSRFYRKNGRPPPPRRDWNTSIICSNGFTLCAIQGEGSPVGTPGRHSDDQSLAVSVKTSRRKWNLPVSTLSGPALNHARRAGVWDCFFWSWDASRITFGLGDNQNLIWFRWERLPGWFYSFYRRVKTCFTHSGFPFILVLRKRTKNWNHPDTVPAGAQLRSRLPSSGSMTDISSCVEIKLVST